MTPYEKFILDLNETLSKIPREFHAFAIKQANLGHYSDDYDEILNTLEDFCDGLVGALETYTLNEYGM